MITPQTEVIAMHGGKQIFRAVLPPGEYLIGREGEVAILLPSEKVSRRHARLTLSYFDWLIEDLSSSNGTRVGGKKAGESTMIFPSQEVKVGDVELRLRRLTLDDAKESLAPQTAALHRYLPAEMRGHGKYKLHGLIAVGGMGAVLEAEDVATRRRVAMKVLLNANTAEDVARFVEEAQITAQLEHPNIVPVYELNVNELDKPYYVMKLVRGEALSQVLAGLRLERSATLERHPLGGLLLIFQKICDAIAYAHSKGVVHRDLKPDNVMLGEFGEAVVMDWGLAKSLGQSVLPSSEDKRKRTVVSSLRGNEPGAIETMEGAAIGTPSFMSPEQAGGRSRVVDGRTDVYALGAILYAILTLRAPVEGADALEVMEKVIAGKITPPEKAVREQPAGHLPDGKLPPELAAIAMKALALKPENRFASVRELQAAVDEVEFDGRRRSGFLGVRKKH
ncbi:MAG: FHA domain-containing serine/threonine-protein kinase [Chthoniobacteraceae bacterium]